MSSKLQLENALGNSLTLEVDDLIASDEVVVINKAIFDKINAIDTKSLATAWVNFDGSDGSIRDSFNVSGVVRDAAGEYTVTFATTMDNKDYCLAGSSAAEGSMISGLTEATQTTTTSTITCINHAGTRVDKIVSATYFGGKN